MSETRVLIVGLGKTGLSCVRFLLKKIAKKNISVTVTDSRVKPPELDLLKNEYPDIAVFTGGFDATAFRAAEQIIISPGVSLAEPVVAEAIKRGIEVIGDIELFSQHVNEPIVAITGSNGKSTVTTLLGEMIQRAGLRAKLGGNLGTPVLDLLSETLSDDKKPDFYILELSSFQLETTCSLNPVASVVLNITADHMDRYRDINHYSVVKKRIYQGNGVIVVNLDDPFVLSLSDDSENLNKKRKKIGFTLNEPQDGAYGLRELAGGVWLARGERKLININDIKIKGRHNLANILAALALAEAIGLPLEKIITCLFDFVGLPHRMQWVGNYKNVDWYNDSKATNVGAAVASVEALSSPLSSSTSRATPKKVILIAGGEGKNADFSPLKAVVEKKVKAIILMGQDARLIAQALGSNVNIVLVKNMQEAVTNAQQQAEEGDSVLLAPACASFDMYSGYEERGLDFMNNARRLCD